MELTEKQIEDNRKIAYLFEEYMVMSFHGWRRLPRRKKKEYRKRAGYKFKPNYKLYFHSDLF